jgi:hypothetical protein
MHSNLPKSEAEVNLETIKSLEDGDKLKVGKALLRLHNNSDFQLLYKHIITDREEELSKELFNVDTVLTEAEKHSIMSKVEHLRLLKAEIRDNGNIVKAMQSTLALIETIKERNLELGKELNG